MATQMEDNIQLALAIRSSEMTAMRARYLEACLPVTETASRRPRRKAGTARRDDGVSALVVRFARMVMTKLWDNIVRRPLLVALPVRK